MIDNKIKRYAIAGYFSFVSKKSRGDIMNVIIDGEKKINFSVEKSDEEAEFIFTNLYGLVCNKFKVIIELLKIDTKDNKSILDFINNYCYFFDYDKIKEINRYYTCIGIEKMKQFIYMTSFLASNSIDYNELMQYLCGFLWTPIEIRKEGYFVHPIMDCWNDEIENRHKFAQEYFRSSENPYECYSPVFFVDVFNSYTKQEENVNVEKYDYEYYLIYKDSSEDSFEYSSLSGMKNTELSNWKFISHLHELYITYNIKENEINTTKKIIDLLYYYIDKNCIDYNEVTCELKWKASNEVKFSDEQKKFIRGLAKEIAAETYNTILSNVHPVYNIDYSLPDWSIPNLYTAIFFANFFRSNESNINRICANEKCNNPVDVSSTRRNKIYCGKKCRDAAAHRRAYKKSRMQVL